MNLVRLLIRILLQAFAVLAIGGCGGGGGGTPEHPPSISNMRYSPSSAFAVPNGSATINGTLAFADAGGDVASLRLVSSAGADLVVPTPALSGMTSGTGIATFVVSVDKVGKHTFEIWAVDGAGQASNRLSGTFEVVAPVEPAHAPAIANLRYAPATAVQAASATVTITGSVDFVAPDGDVAALRLVSSAGADLTVATPGLRGVRSGTGTGIFVVPVDTVGRYTFEIWVIDSAGRPSNRLAGTFEVVAPVGPAHAPSIANLRYSPSSATQAWGGTAAITGSFDFTDAGGDIATARMVSSDGTDVTVAMASLSGMTNGSATATFVVPVGKAGRRTFDVWAIDRLGRSSNPLSGAFEVLPPATDTWVRLGVAPPKTLFAVGSNGRQFVAVGAGGTIMTSADLGDWKVQTPAVTHALRSVASSPSRFVAVGDNGGEAVVISSADGAAWSVQYRSGPAPSQLAKVIWTGTQFVAVGAERNVAAARFYALVLTSPDGTTWTQRAPQSIELGETGFPVERNMTSVASSGSLLVAVGLMPPFDPAVWISANADAWTRNALPPSAVAFFPPGDITWGSGRFVAVSPVPGFDGHSPTFASAAAIHWQSQPSGVKLPEMNAVAAGINEYVAVGSSYRMRSADGVAWTVSPMSGCGNGVLWSGSRYVSVGDSICLSP